MKWDVHIKLSISVSLSVSLTFIPWAPQPSHSASISWDLLWFVREVDHIFSTLVATTAGAPKDCWNNIKFIPVNNLIYFLEFKESWIYIYYSNSDKVSFYYYNTIFLIKSDLQVWLYFVLPGPGPLVHLSETSATFQQH